MTGKPKVWGSDCQPFITYNAKPCILVCLFGVFYVGWHENHELMNLCGNFWSSNDIILPASKSAHKRSQIVHISLIKMHQMSRFVHISFTPACLFLMMAVHALWQRTCMHLDNVRSQRLWAYVHNLSERTSMKCLGNEDNLCDLSGIRILVRLASISAGTYMFQR